MTATNSGPEMIEGPPQSGGRALAETASSSVAAQAQAQVQARYVMAKRFPRRFDQVRTRMLKACERTLFAEAAIYHKPMGGEKFVEGPSIRFAEEAARCLGNLLAESMVTYDDMQKRIVRYSVTDLETNLSYYLDRTIDKTVERKYLKKGQVALSSRLNSYDEIVHIIPANDDQTATKEAAVASKTLRELFLRHLPSDIREECMNTIAATLDSEEQKDPGAEKKRVIDGFVKLNIEPVNLEEYLQHSLDTVSPAELKRLRGIWAAINTGESTWSEVMDQRVEAKRPEPSKVTPQEKPKDLAEAAARARSKREPEATKEETKETTPPPSSMPAVDVDHFGNLQAAAKKAGVSTRDLFALIKAETGRDRPTEMTAEDYAKVTAAIEAKK